MIWLDVPDAAALVGIAERNMRKAVQRGSYRGHPLTVQTVPGRGGAAGKHRYQILLSSLPPELQTKHAENRPAQTELALPEPAAHALAPVAIKRDPAAEKRASEGTWRYHVIAPVIGFPRNSRDRRDALKAAVEKEHVRPDGSTVTLSAATLYMWCSAFESGGLAALDPQGRADRGRSRVLVSREWDSAAPLDPAVKLQVAKDLTDYIRSCWAAGCSGWRAIQTMAQNKLIELSKEAGWNAPEGILLETCAVSRAAIEQHRKYGVIAIKDKDAKQFFDKYLPRIRRTRANLRPMEVVVGDVHPIDIAVRRADGTVAYPRAIAWHDVATNRLYLTIILFEKGEAVKQVHVAASFASMVARWGLPQTLYLDNGSEYSWWEMINSFKELSRLAGALSVAVLAKDGDDRALVEDARSVIRAKPYNAPAKPVEGLFSVLEGGPLAMLPGWTGGDRVKKKTQNVGHQPTPFPGDLAEFHGAIETALAWYHNTEQSGTMAGKSPNEVYRDHVMNGWTRIDVPERVMLLAFAEEKTPRISQGYFQFDGIEYYDDALLPYTGQRLPIRVARHDPRYAFAFDKAGGDLLCAAGIAPVYGFLDKAGAEEQARREKLVRRWVAELRQDCDRLDLVEEMRKVVEAKPKPISAPIGATVGLSGEAGQMLAALEAKEASAKEHRKAAADGGPKRLSQWASADEHDPYLAEVAFADEDNAQAAGGTAA